MWEMKSPHPCWGLSLQLILNSTESRQKTSGTPWSQRNPCQHPKGDSQPPHSCAVPLAYSGLPRFIYLFYSPLFCLEKTYLFLLPWLRPFFQLLPNPRATGFASLFRGGAIPCPLSGWPAASSWEVTRTCQERERCQVGDVVFGTLQRLWGWSIIQGCGFSPGLNFQ